MPTQEINSWEDLQRSVKRIAVSLENDDNLKTAAASNPLFALEDLGYIIPEDLKASFEDRLRFPPEDAGKLAALRDEVLKIAGRRFNIRSRQELNNILFDDLNLVAYDDKACPLNQNIPVLTNRTKDKGDPLLEYKGLHPIVDPLLAFRDLDSTKPAFCDKEDYLNIRKGTHPVNSRIKLSIRLKPH